MPLYHNNKNSVRACKQKDALHKIVMRIDAKRKIADTIAFSNSQHHNLHLE